RVDGEDAPQIVVTADGGVLVAWTGESKGRMAAFVSRSTDGGRSFGRPQAVKGTGNNPQIRVILTPTADGPRLSFLDPTGVPGDGHGGRLYSAELPPAGGGRLVAKPLASQTCQCC